MLQNKPAQLRHTSCAGLWRHHHDSFALFVAAVAPRGAERALQLSGLTLRGEAALARRSGALRRALQCLAAAAVGARDRAALNTHALWHARAAPGQGVQSLAELVAGEAQSSYVSFSELGGLLSLGRQLLRSA